MATPLRAFLMLRLNDVWDVAVFHDLEGLVKAWEQRADSRATAVVHIGFERTPARHFDDAISGFPAQVLLTAGAKYALPTGYHSTETPVVNCRGIDLFLATQGWGYVASAPQVSAPNIAVARPSFSDWLSGFVAGYTEGEEALVAAGIFDDAAYLVREAILPRELRVEAGLYRYRLLCRNTEDPCEIAAGAPPWLRERSFKETALTVRLANVFTRLGVEVVSDLDRFTMVELLKIPNCGRKSVNDLIDTLNAALAAGPLDREGALTTIQEIGLISAVRRSLLNCGERERDILSSRMGLDGAPETLQEIGLRYGVSRERIRQIEAKTIGRLLEVELWDDLLVRKLRDLLASREYPLPLRGIEAVDPWFSSVGDRAEVVRYLLATVPGLGAALVEIDGIEYLSLINQERWQASVLDARSLLAGGVGRGWPESKCRRLVEGLLPEGGQEFRELLWRTASQQCHFVDGDGGERYLLQYGRGADQAVETVLAESERPLHFTEIAIRASERAGHQIEVRRAHNSAANVGFLFARGTYGLLKHLPITTTEMERIAEQAEDLVADSALEKQWHSAELLAALSERTKDIPPVDRYILDIALQTSGNLRRHGRMVWSRPNDRDNDAARIDIRQAIIATIQLAGRPLRASDVRQRLIAARGLSQHFQIQQLDPLIRVGPAVWGLNDRDVEIKRQDQAQFTQRLARLLEERGAGVHISEVSTVFDLPPSMRAEAVFSIAILDERLRVNVGQYLYLRAWGEARRTTIQEAVRNVLTNSAGFTGFETIVAAVEAQVGRRCERTAISGSLQGIGAEFDGRGMWRLQDASCEDEDEDDGTEDHPIAGQANAPHETFGPSAI